MSPARRKAAVVDLVVGLTAVVGLVVAGPVYAAGLAVMLLIAMHARTPRPPAQRRPRNPQRFAALTGLNAGVLLGTTAYAVLPASVLELTGPLVVSTDVAIGGTVGLATALGGLLVESRRRERQEVGESR